jgi:hypothetical protein
MVKAHVTEPNASNESKSRRPPTLIGHTERINRTERIERAERIDRSEEISFTQFVLLLCVNYNGSMKYESVLRNTSEGNKIIKFIKLM